jgi:phosphatidylserine/phosphatidylglycerophosphate/cardiolipin synthase-like enzyme
MSRLSRCLRPAWVVSLVLAMVLSSCSAGVRPPLPTAGPATALAPAPTSTALAPTSTALAPTSTALAPTPTAPAPTPTASVPTSTAPVLTATALVPTLTALASTPVPAAAVDWEVAFTSPIAPPDTDASRHHGGLDDKLVALIRRAVRTVDVADYDFDLADVAQAMAEDAQRGVRVRMVTDSDTLDNIKDKDIQAAFKTLKDANIEVVPDRRQPIMHNKFTVVDGEWVETGSWNYTDGDTYHLNNNLAIFHSTELADNYTAEFEKMFTQRKFGPNKPKGVPHPVLQIGDLAVQNYFAAEDGVARHVVDAVAQAQQSIHFLAFSYTHDGLGAAMLARHQDAQVDVQGVFETTGSNTQFSEYGKLKQAGLEVYQDGNPYVMHHKIILIDGHVTIFGSFNFSENADKDNDENLLIVDSPTFAAPFEQEYQRMRELARNPPARQKQTTGVREKP